MTEFEHLKMSIKKLVQKMESDKHYNLETSVDALCSITRYFEKMGGEYKRREKLNKELDNDK